MEQEFDPSRNTPKIGNSEIQAAISEGERDIKEAENLLKESLEDLKQAIDLLEMDAAYLEHMQGNNEFIEEYKNDIGAELSLRKYDDDEISKIKLNVERAKLDIKNIHEFMTTLTLDKIATEEYVEEFKKLEESFKAVLLRVDPGQQN